jgi:type IV secretory pathway VirB9-like protein
VLDSANNKSKRNMKIVIVKKLDNGYIVMSGDGETAFINEEIYQKLLNQNKIENGISNNTYM